MWILLQNSSYMIVRLDCIGTQLRISNYVIVEWLGYFSKLRNKKFPYLPVSCNAKIWQSIEIRVKRPGQTLRDATTLLIRPPCITGMLATVTKVGFINTALYFGRHECISFPYVDGDNTAGQINLHDNNQTRNAPTAVPCHHWMRSLFSCELKFYFCISRKINTRCIELHVSKWKFHNIEAQ